MKNALTRRMNILWQIFCVFFKIGPSTFGGGYAMIATIEEEIVHRKGWMNQEEMGDMVSISGSAPGGVAVNSAAFIGYRLGGIPGAVTAVAAITLPTFIIVFLLSLLSYIFKDNAKVAAALKGIHAAVVSLIILAAFKMWKSSVLDAATLVIAGIAVALLLFTGIHSFYLILGGPIAGTIVVLIKRKCGMTVRTEKARTEEKQELHFPEYYI
ncbi:MAG: chromate transporter [Paenibacillus macerans]|uniref:Chromate transporter n=2 Tax=Paenibacillus macerans TaxID=44252 RepID=A0A6N8F3X6_PAEMA|nr:chromate transporter [Paenibacillus macerans]MBS5913869.1 chromate transporter [Paenibacillus macerans]MCY7561638.1 chromate transporter [Paenibacillus macerans]MDU7477171.1 chromate transporter [Paenibacillus macerans]MEC0135770.1 chromate transporter [Paenibacillus macerans]MEC0151927.1 chromate transporter [Paenibacillus macerans]